MFCDDGEISVDMGVPRVGGQVRVGVEGRAFEATAVDMGNPHAVAFVESLDEVGPLHVGRATWPRTSRTGSTSSSSCAKETTISLRCACSSVGSGRPSPAGPGACAAVVAASLPSAGPSGTTYTVDVLGGRLTVTWDGTGHVRLKGPAVLVAEGTWTG